MDTWKAKACALMTAHERQDWQTHPEGLRLARQVLLEAEQESNRDHQDVGFTAQNMRSITARMHENHVHNIQKYTDWKRTGKMLKVFPTRAHLGAFLVHSAPTKLCDGIWLRGIGVHPPECPADRMLYEIYQDEIGHGHLRRNHVVLYQELMQALGTLYFRADHPELLACLPDSCYKDPAVQLALGLLGKEVLPEVLGYTLGYEQFAPSLALTRDALRHHGLPPTYFSTHLSIDNLDCGHARQILECVSLYLQDLNREERALVEGRILNGYRWNQFTVPMDKDWTPAVRALFRHRMTTKCTYASSIHHHSQPKLNRLIAQTAQTGDCDALMDYLQRRKLISHDGDTGAFEKLATAKMEGAFSSWDFDLLRAIVGSAPHPSLERNRLVHQGSDNEF